MLDSIQGRGPGMAFIPYCSLPELEACMEVWGFMEMIHSRSYTYIIKNVYSDPSEVLDKIVTDKRILERAESVTEHMMTSLTVLKPGALGVCGRVTLEIHQHHNGKSKMSSANSTEQLLMLTFLRVLGSMLVLLVSFCFW